MTSRWLLAALAAVSFLMLPARASEADGGARIEGCRFADAAAVPTKIRLLVETRAAVAFTAQSPDGRAVFACRRGSRASQLGLTIHCPLDCNGIRAVAVSGRFAAFESLENGSRDASDFDDVVVYDLKARRIINRADAGGYSRVLGDPPYRAPVPGQISDLVLTAAGTAAWITQDQRTTPTTFSVWTHVRGQAARRQAAGTGITPGSLAASHGHLYWTDTNIAATTTIP